MAEIFETTDADVASAIYSQQYSAMQLRMRGSRSLFRIAQTPVGRARLEHSTYRATLQGQAAALDQIIVVRIRDGVVRYSCGDSEQTYGPGDTGVPLPLGRDWSVRLRDVDSDVVVLDPALLDDVAGVSAEPGATEPSRVRLLSDRPWSASATAQLWRASEAVGSMIAAIDAEAYPLVVASADRLLAASVLSAFPHTAAVEPTTSDRRDGHPATLRRAVAFLEAHPDQPVTVGDVARAAHVSVRAIQVAFQRHLGTTPMAYLRRVRLDHARADLHAADPSQQTVTAIAARWGWGQPSRFAADYRATFGHQPSRALRSER